MKTEFEEDILHCLEVLRSGGVIVYPTDTVWGLGCDATNENAVERVFTIKQRPGSKALIVLLADVRDINKYVAAPPPDAAEYLESCAGPTTVIYQNALGLAANLLAEDGTAAIRVVRDDFCRQLVKRFRFPVVSTSANLTGQAAPAVFSELSQEILSAADYVVNYRRHDPVRRSPSKLVRFGSDGKLVVLRS